MSEKPMTYAEYQKSLEGDVVSGNLKKMNTDMMQFLQDESIGGNAGAIEIDGTRFYCEGANSFMNPTTGEILVFNNPQNVAEDIRHANVLVRFRVATDKKSRPFRIVEYTPEGELSPAAQEVLNASVGQWNASRPAPDLKGF